MIDITSTYFSTNVLLCQPPSPQALTFSTLRLPMQWQFKWKTEQTGAIYNSVLRFLQMTQIKHAYQAGSYHLILKTGGRSPFFHSFCNSRFRAMFHTPFCSCRPLSLTMINAFFILPACILYDDVARLFVKCKMHSSLYEPIYLSIYLSYSLFSPSVSMSTLCVALLLFPSMLLYRSFSFSPSP